MSERAGSRQPGGGALAAYLIVLCITAALTVPLSYIVSRTAEMTGCDVAGSRQDRFVAVCAVPAFADYEHAAFYRDMEPEAIDSLRRASVVVMGDSRIQWALSRSMTETFFSARHLSYYLLGFGYVEQGTFPLELLEKFGARPKVVIVNVDPFFDASESSAAIDAKTPTWRTWVDFEIKAALQRGQRLACLQIAWLCGHRNAIYRSRSTGAWTWDSATLSPEHRPIPANVPFVPDDVLAPLVARAKTMIARMRVAPGCVVLTQLPNPTLDYSPLIRAVAAATGASVVRPEVGPLSTIDDSHLDNDGADRWARGFYEAADAIIARCTAPA